MKNLREFDREIHCLYKQRKARMITADLYRNRIERLKDRAFNDIREWNCPSCLRLMEMHNGDDIFFSRKNIPFRRKEEIAELWCECGLSYNKTWLISLTPEARRKLRDDYLSLQRHYQARREDYVNRRGNKDYIDRTIKKVLEKNKNQRSLDAFQ